MHFTKSVNTKHRVIITVLLHMYYLAEILTEAASVKNKQEYLYITISLIYHLLINCLFPWAIHMLLNSLFPSTISLDQCVLSVMIHV